MASKNDSVLEQLMARSEKFGTKNKFPISTNLTKTLLQQGVSRNVLERNVLETYPLVHENVLKLMEEFIKWKKVHGNEVEKGIYNEQMTIPALIDRLLQKRPLCFIGNQDRYVLRYTKQKGQGGFDSIGTLQEKPPLVMSDYLTYDEMKLSALIGTCSPTCNINKGDRRNRGVVGEDGTFVKHSYIVGLVGTRMGRLHCMESQDIRITQEQNIQGSFYGAQTELTLGSLFSKFYRIARFPCYNEVKDLFDGSKKQDRKKEVLDAADFVALDALSTKRGPKKLNTREFFNKKVYNDRIRIVAETLFAEANYRAGMENKKAYVHIVGLGLGVWKIIENQEQYYVDAFSECLETISYPNISDIDFSWIPVDNVRGTPNGTLFPNTDINVHVSKRCPYEPIENGDQKIIVVAWAYDSNSYPGNEYWKGTLAGSGDSAAACATQIAELHNPMVNLHMSGKNLKIVSKDGKIKAFTSD